MTNETLTLQLEFKDAEKKTRQLNLEHTKQDLSAELVQQAMNQIVTSHLIDKKKESMRINHHKLLAIFVELYLMYLLLQKLGCCLNYSFN